MALITRISRLFTADLHALLDRVEEPELLLKQGIRDMQDAVAAGDRRIRALRARARQLAAARASIEQRLHETAEEVDVCLAIGNDELARSVVQRRLQLERHLAELASQAEEVALSVTEQERALTARRRELEVLASQAALFDTAEGQNGDPMSAPAVSADEVEIALLREKQRRARP